MEGEMGGNIHLGEDRTINCTIRDPEFMPGGRRLRLIDPDY